MRICAYGGQENPGRHSLRAMDLGLGDRPGAHQEGSRAIQGGPGVLLSPPPQCLDVKYRSPSLAFHLGSELRLRSLCLCNKNLME